MNINILLFENFETLDAFGPAEIFGKISDFQLGYFSMTGGVIKSSQLLEVQTQPVSAARRHDVWLIPGGQGTRTLVNDEKFLLGLRELAEKAQFCLSVCTGSALLAKCGILDGAKATSNKRALSWVKSLSDKVLWQDKARWVVSGKFYTSSGVSAGMDMALGFAADVLGRGCAEETANRIEYIWNSDSNKDPFYIR